MADNFKYVINAQLKLNTGSLNTLLKDISTLDGNIKKHFEKADGGVRVPVRAHNDISKLQKDISGIVDKYNKGQAPSIRIKVVPDEQSIGKLQQRISEVKKQLQSLSDEQARVSVNTSLKVGRNEGEEVQKQVEGIKPVIEVQVVPDEASIKKLKDQIESIKADVKATVSAIQDHTENMPNGGRFRGANSNQTSINRTNRQNQNPISSKDMKRDYAEAHQYYRDMAQQIQSQIKGEQELNHLKSELNRAQNPEKARKSSNMYGYDLDGAKSLKNVQEYTKQLQDEIRKQEKLMNQLKRAQQLTEIARVKMAQEPFMTPQISNSLNRLNSKPSQQNKVANQISQAEINRRIKEQEQQAKDMQRLMAHLEDRSKMPSYAYDPLNDAKQGISKASAEKAMKDQMAQAKQHAKDLEKQQKEMAQLYSHLYTMGNTANINDPLFDTKQNIAKASVNKSMKDRVAEAKSGAKSQAEQEKDMAQLMAHLYSMNNMPNINDPLYDTKQNIARASATKSMNEHVANKKQQERDSQRDKERTDYYAGYRRFGYRGEQQARDYEAMLTDPSIGLKDSLNILKYLHNYNSQTAVNTGMNFQKAYAIKYTGEDGTIHNIRGLTTEYTKLGEVIERSDKGFQSMMGHMVSKVGVYSMMEGALVGISVAIEDSVRNMVDFNQQLAEVQSLTQNLSTSSTGTLKNFYQSAGGTNQLQAQVSNDAYGNAQTYGVSALETVLPIEQAVIARHSLVSGNGTGQYDSNLKDQIVKNIMQFSAVSTGGKETPEVTNELTTDLLSLYQANQQKDPANYMQNMQKNLDFLSAMRTSGVNTTAVTNAYAELAPETMASGIDPMQTMAMMGAYNLADASATGNDVETIGKTFFNSILHAGTNDHLKNALSTYLGINLDAKPMEAPELLKTIQDRYKSNYNNIQDNTDAQTQLAIALSSTGGGNSGKAMSPKMVKLLQGMQGSDYNEFMSMAKDGSYDGAMAKSWMPFSKQLKTQFDQLIQTVQQFGQLLGQLGVADSLGLVVTSFNKILGAVNAVLRKMQEWSSFLEDHNIPDIVKFTAQVTTLALTLKGLQSFINKAKWGGAVGDAIANSRLGTALGGYSLGIRRNGITTTSKLASAGALGAEELISNPPIVIPTSTGMKYGPALAEDVAKDATKSKGALSSVGNFFNDMLFISALKKGKAGAGAVEEGASIATKTFGESLAGILPALRTFGLLVGRLSILGAIIAGISLAWDAFQNHQKSVDEQATASAQSNFQKAQNDPKFKKQSIKDIKDFINLDSHPISNVNDYNRYKKVNEDMRKKWNITYNGSPTDKDATISYVDASGTKQTAHVNSDNKKSKAEMQQFWNNFSNNGGVSSEITDAWKVNTDYIGNYNQKLQQANEITAQISNKMKELQTTTASIDATFGGINSSTALGQKIDAIDSTLSGTSKQRTQLNKMMTPLNVNLQELQIQYDKEASKASKKAGISDSKLTDMETAVTVARQNGSDLSAIQKMYTVSSKNSKSKNNENSALQTLASLYFTLSNYKDSYNSTNDQYQQLEQQQEQLNLQKKQYEAQKELAKLGLDAMNASLQTMNSIYNASKTIVTMSQNPIQGGDPSAQISALHGSMQVSSAQMNMMISQQSAVQKSMNNLKAQNPNQDFSLNALYNPSGEVSAQQLEYKSLYEQQQQITDSINNQSSAMYDQLTQMRDLVLNSNQYADAWQRVQDNVQLVKESLKNTSDFQYQLSTLNSNSAFTAGLTGQSMSSVALAQLQSIRDTNAGNATALNTAGASAGDDKSRLQSAWADILNQEGQSFNDNMVKPLNAIVSNFNSYNGAFGNNVNSFTNAVNQFGQDVSTNNTNMQNAVNGLNNAVSQQASLNSSSQSSTGSYGAVTNTGQTIQGGQFAEKDYQSEMSPYARGAYAGNVDMFVQAGAKYGVPPELLLAIAMSENSGDSNILNHSNNVGNIKATGSSPEWGGASYDGYRAYGSLQDGINDLSHLISEKIASGYNTIPLINKHYAEDPNWMNNVASFMAKMTGTSQSSWLGDATVNGGFNIGGSGAGASNTGASVTSVGGGGGGGTNGMFGWFNSVLNNTSAMQYSWGGAHVVEDWSTFLQKAVADCSGLVEQVYKQFAGINLGTTTAQGIYSDNNGGTPVSRSQLQPGDLVFFGGGTNDISHVGVYAGSNQMYTIDHDGMPVTKENIWSDYVAGKHFNIGGGGGGGGIANPANAGATPIETLVANTNSQNASIQATIASYPYIIQQLKDQITQQQGQAVINGNAQDVMGTAGKTGYYDSIVQARGQIGTELLKNTQAMQADNAKRDDIISNLNNAYNSGDVDRYHEYFSQLVNIDQLIKALGDNTDQLKALDATYEAEQRNDPRFAYQPASDSIAGGINTLRLFNDRGQTYSSDYFRVANELGTMQSQYMTHQKQTSILKNVFDTWGEQANQYSNAKSNSDQDQINLVNTQLKNITQNLNQFATGTQQWYSALNTTVEVQKKILSLEQQRLDDAQSNFDNTGTGSEMYVQQKAYMNSLNYSNAYKGLQDALNTYHNGFSTNSISYGVSTGSFRDLNTANEASGIITKQYGIQGNVVQNPDGSYRIVTDTGMTGDTANNIKNMTSSLTQGMTFQSSNWANNDFGFVSAHTVADAIKAKFGIDMNVINPTGQAISVRSASNNMSQSDINAVGDWVKSQYGLLSWGEGQSDKGNLLGGGKYGIWTSHWANNDFGFVSAHHVADDVMNKFGVGMNVINPTGDGIALQSKDQNLSQDLTLQIQQYMKDKYGLLSWSTGSGNASGTEDFNQQMANYQVIADAHNKMTEQMDTYKQAVTDAFKANAMSVDEYISKLNQLRDVQTEQQTNAVNMIGNIQGGFSSSLSSAITSGMQGNINAPLDFMNGIKQSLSDSVSSQLTDTLLKNTGLQDTMNSITSAITKASTSGNANDIVNMFNNNDFGKQIEDAIAPFLPMIQQIVGSTKGIFTILKDQVYNSPSGFKIDNYMNEIATKQTYAGLKYWANPNVNSVGSPILNFNNSGWIQTTPASQTPTGIPNGTSTPTNGSITTSQTGAPENTTGAGTGPIPSSNYTTLPPTDPIPYSGTPPASPAPAPSASSSSGGRSYTVQSGDNPWTIENRLGLPHGWIMQHNPNVNPNGLQIGQVLQYHTGGIAGIMNFSSGQGLKPNELSAILQKSETIFQPNQLDDLVSGAMKAGANANSGGVNLTVNVNIDGGGNFDQKGIEAVVETAVSKAMAQFKKTSKMNNLSWKGTSY